MKVIKFRLNIHARYKGKGIIKSKYDKTRIIHVFE